MGGNIFPKTKRIESKEDYKNLFKIQKELLKDVCEGMVIPSQLTSKTSFGDLDILAPSKYLEATEAFLKLHEYAYSLSGNNLSYLFEDIQIDLIFVEELNLSFSQSFYSFSAQSRILSSAFNDSDFTFKPEGLYYRYYRKDLNLKKLIRVPYRHTKILEVLKLDSRKFLEGFETEKDVFEFICESPFLNFERLEKIFKDNSNGFLSDFSKYITENPSLKETPPEDLNFFVPSQYCIFYKEYFDLQDFCKSQLDFKSKFNGPLVSKLTGLEGKALGKFILRFKDKYSFEDIVSISPKQIEFLIKNFK